MKEADFPRIRKIATKPNWVYGNGLHSYRLDFGELMADWESVLLPKLRALPQVIGLDLMSNKITLRSLKQDYRLNNLIGLAVEYNPDFRKPVNYYPSDSGIEYKNLDLQKSGSWEQINDWLDGKKVTILFERGNGGLSQVSHRRTFYTAIASRIWSIMDPQWSTAFLQIPPHQVLLDKGIDLPTWIDKVKDIGIGCLWIKTQKSMTLPKFKDWEFGYLRLEKTADIPLPPLD